MTENENDGLKKVIEMKLKSKADKIKEKPDTYDLSDLRDLCQLNLFREKAEE